MLSLQEGQYVGWSLKGKGKLRHGRKYTNNKWTPAKGNVNEKPLESGQL